MDNKTCEVCGGVVELIVSIEETVGTRRRDQADALPREEKSWIRSEWHLLKRLN